MSNKTISYIFFFLLLAATFFQLSYGDIGVAAHYSPPYVPTACRGSDESQFPQDNVFAAASDGIWDNGASCGREYLVRCISAAGRGICKPDVTIRVRIVDHSETSASRPSAGGTTMVLSETAFALIANPSAPKVNVEFLQV